MNSPMTEGSQIDFFDARSHPSGSEPGTIRELSTGAELELEHGWFEGVKLEVDLATNSRTWNSDRSKTSITMSHARGTNEVNLPDLHQCFSLWATQRLSNEFYHIIESILNTPFPPGTSVEGFESTNSNRFAMVERPVATYRDAFFLIGVPDGSLHADVHTEHCPYKGETDCHRNCKLDDESQICVYYCHWMRGIHYDQDPDRVSYNNSVFYEDLDEKWHMYPMPGYPDSVELGLTMDGSKIIVSYSR